MEVGSLYKSCSYILVGVLWGCTNPFLKAGSKADKKSRTAEAQSLFQKLWNLIRKFMNPYVFVPFAINQLGSVAFYYLLATDNISAAVPICNSLTFAFTGITGWMLGEHVHRPVYFTVGVICVALGIAICLNSPSPSNSNSSTSVA